MGVKKRKQKQNETKKIVNSVFHFLNQEDKKIDCISEILSIVSISKIFVYVNKLFLVCKAPICTVHIYSAGQGLFCGTIFFCVYVKCSVMCLHILEISWTMYFVLPEVLFVINEPAVYWTISNYLAGQLNLMFGDQWPILENIDILFTDVFTKCKFGYLQHCKRKKFRIFT